MKSRKTCAALALLALALTGCSTEDGPDGGPDGGPDDPSTTASSEGTASASPSDGGSDGVAPATGKQMGDEHVSFRLPAEKGWGVAYEGTVGYLAPPDDRISQINIGGAGASIDNLDDAASSGLKSLKADRSTARREENRTVAGLEGVVLTAEDDNGYFYILSTISGGENVSIVFDLPRNDAAAHELIDAVLASVTWK